MKGKSSQSSEIVMNELVLPNDTNLLGNLLGGRLVHWIDIAGGMAASRHANSIVVTASVDSIDFRQPVRLGDIVKLKARLTWTGRTSMEVRVAVFAEDVVARKVTLINQTYLVYVALSNTGKPKKVPPLILKTGEERREFREAEKRRINRLAKRRSKSIPVL